MALSKSKLALWEALKKETYQSQTIEQITSRYNTLFNCEVEKSHAVHTRVLIKKILKEEIKQLKKAVSSSEELEDLINSLKFDIQYH